MLIEDQWSDKDDIRIICLLALPGSVVVLRFSGGSRVVKTRDRWPSIDTTVVQKVSNVMFNQGFNYARGKVVQWKSGPRIFYWSA